MTNQNQHPKALPETLTVNGQVINVKDSPELQAFIAEVRGVVSTEERNKLYTKIRDLEAKTEALLKVAPEASINESTVKAVTEPLVAQFTKQLETLLAEKLSPLVKSAEEVSAASLNDYKLKLFAENQGTFIEELVVGESKEELDKAMNHAKEVFAKYNGSNPAFRQVTTTPAMPSEEGLPKPAAPAQSAAPTTEAPKPQPPAIPVPGSAAAPEVKDVTARTIESISPENWAKEREAIFEDIKKLAS